VTKAALGGRAIQRAVTRVKPEQASKVMMWMPTRLSAGEGRVEWGSNRRMHLFRSTGVMGTARWEGGPGNRGGPVPAGGRNSKRRGEHGGPGGSRTGSYDL